MLQDRTIKVKLAVSWNILEIKAANNANKPIPLSPQTTTNNRQKEDTYKQPGGCLILH